MVRKCHSLRGMIHSLKLALAGLIVGATAGAVLLLRWALRVAEEA